MTDTGDQSLTVHDNRTGKDYQIPIDDGYIKAADLGQIKDRRGHAGHRDVRPRVREHRLVQERGDLHRR